MTIEVLISTYNEDIYLIPSQILPPKNNIQWLVSFQYSESHYLSTLPSELIEREDVTLIIKKGKGLSSNRNMALEAAKGDLLVLSDADAHFKPSYFQTIFKTFEAHSDLDIAFFQAETYEGQLLHAYPNVSFNYKDTPKGFWYNSLGIVIKRSNFLPQFDTRFGLNASYFGCGEEELFLFEAFKKGLKIQYFPKVIICTKRKTSANRFYQDKSLQRAKGAVLCEMHGPFSATLRCLKYAIFNNKQSCPLFLFFQMLKGIILVRK